MAKMNPFAKVKKNTADGLPSDAPGQNYSPPSEPEPGEAAEPAGALSVSVSDAEYPALKGAQVGDTFSIAGTARVTDAADGQVKLDIEDADFEASGSADKGAGFDEGSAPAPDLGMQSAM